MSESKPTYNAMANPVGPPKRQGVIIFADGACSGNPGPGGWGAIVIELADKVEESRVTELGGKDLETTNNRMEMTALGMGLRFVEEIEGGVLVYTDSSYVINGLTKWMSGWIRNGWKKSDGGEVANELFWKRLKTVLDAREDRGLGGISYNYVPGHSGVTGNERCDEIAVAFTRQGVAELFQGSLARYEEFLGVSIFMGLEKAEDGPPVRSAERSVNGDNKVVYLSYVNGRLERHASWPECEARVKGRSGAKFKKCKGDKEVLETMKGWGL